MQFFRDLIRNDSNLSMMRFMSILGLLFGAAITIYAMIYRSNLDGVAPLVAVFVGSAYGGKTVQKYIETKNIDVNK
jgi:hypothetical protein